MDKEPEAGDVVRMRLGPQVQVRMFVLGVCRHGVTLLVDGHPFSKARLYTGSDWFKFTRESHDDIPAGASPHCLTCFAEWMEAGLEYLPKVPVPVEGFKIVGRDWLRQLHVERV